MAVHLIGVGQVRCVPGGLDHRELRIRDRLGEGTALIDRDGLVLVSVDHERRGFDLAEPLTDVVALAQRREDLAQVAGLDLAPLAPPALGVGVPGPRIRPLRMAASSSL